MKTIIKRILYLFSIVIQLSLIAAVFKINDLTSKRAGVMRHVYHKRIQYEQGVYSPANLLWQKIIAVVLGVLLILVLIYLVKKGVGLFYKLQVGLASFLSFLVYFVKVSGTFKNMLAYPYFIMTFQLILLIQLIIVIVITIKRSYLQMTK